MSLESNKHGNILTQEELLSQIEVLLNSEPTSQATLAFREQLLSLLDNQLTHNDFIDPSLSPEDKEKFFEITKAFPRNHTNTPIQNGLIGDKWDDALKWRKTCKKNITPPVYRLNIAKNGIVFDLEYTDSDGISHTTTNIPFGAGQSIINNRANQSDGFPTADAPFDQKKYAYWVEKGQIRHRTTFGQVVHMNRVAVNALVQNGEITLLDLGIPRSPQACAFQATYGEDFLRLAGIPLTGRSNSLDGGLVTGVVGRSSRLLLRHGHLHVYNSGAIISDDNLDGYSVFPQDIPSIS